MQSETYISTLHFNIKMEKTTGYEEIIYINPYIIGLLSFYGV